MKSKHIHFDEVTDVNEMRKKGIESLPVWEVDGKMLGFLEANSYINSLGNQE